MLLDSVTHVRTQVGLLLFSRNLLLGLGGSGSFLLLLLGLPLAELQTLLQLRLGDHLAGDRIELEVGHGDLGLLDSVLIRHVVCVAGKELGVDGGMKNGGAREILGGSHGGSHGGVCPIGPILQRAPPRLCESFTIIIAIF